MISQPASTPLRPEFVRQLDRTVRATAGGSGRARFGRTRSAGRGRPAPCLLTRTCLLLGTVGMLKLCLLASVGEAAYGERVARLAQGSWAERTAAWVIQPDPVTVAVRDDLARFTWEIAPTL